MSSKIQSADLTDVARKEPWALPTYELIHPWMPRKLQSLRKRLADVLNENYYDLERIFTKRDKP